MIRQPDFSWPGAPPFPRFGRGAWWVQDTFDGWGAATATIVPDWVRVAGGGGTLSIAKVVPVAGDTVSRGILGFTLNDDPAAAVAAWRRRDTAGVAVDGYGPEAPLHTWCRFQSIGPEPGAAADYYLSPFGVAAQAVGVVEPLDGMGLVFDSTLGVASWVVRAWRGGVALDLPLSEPWVDNTGTDVFDECKIVNDGNRISVFWNGAFKGEIVGPEIQPSQTCQPYHGHMALLAPALGFNPSVNIDLWGWGSPGAI